MSRPGIRAITQPRGLDVIGVHTPEFNFEHVTSNVKKRAVKQLGVTYPVAMEN